MSENPIGDMLAKAEFDTSISPMVDSCREYLKGVEKEHFRIKESQFIHELLPLIAGEEGSSVDISFWYHNVGSFFKPIDVFNDAGNEKLFTVPPLFNRKSVELRAQEDDLDTITSVLATAENKRNLGEDVAARYLLTEFHNRIIDKTDYLSEFEHINAILVRYGKQPLTLNKEAAEALPAAEADTGKPESGYNINNYQSGGLD